MISRAIISRGCDEAKLFRPRGLVVVDADVALDLARLGLRTLEVEISKTINIRIADVASTTVAGQKIRKQYPTDTDHMILQEPDCPEMRRKSPRYFEVICWVERDLREGRILHEYDIGHPSGFDDVEIKNTVAANELLDEIHILKSGGIFLSNEAYAVLGPALDLDFFFVKQLA